MRATHFIILLILLCLASCEEPFTPDVPDVAPELVIEGYIEAGERPTPPLVILTRSVPFFETITLEEFNDLFVRDANVTVDDGTTVVQLQEVCLEDLTPLQLALVSSLLGDDLTQFDVNFCLYTDLTNTMIGTAGRTYELKVDAEEYQASGITTIPEQVRLDSLVFREPPGEPNDTLAQLIGFISDPLGVNFYRYFSRVNEEPLLPGFPSVTDDRLFEGQSFEFPLGRALSREVDFEEIDINTIGLFTRGDTVQIRFTTLGQPHFDFWNTLEFNAANSGPFSTYTRIQSNVEGAIGVWGGYNGVYYDLIVPEL